MTTRIGKNGRPYVVKTDRVWGALTKQILEVAQRGEPFTRHDVLDGSNQVYNRLHLLAKKGVLSIVHKGTTGPGGNPTIYKLNKQNQQNT